jgi:hypothetical protein
LAERRPEPKKLGDDHGGQEGTKESKYLLIHVEVAFTMVFRSESF